MNIDFAGQAVIVTGAAQGLGREIVTRFTALGASVWAADVDTEGLERTTEAAGSGCRPHPLDVTDRDGVGRLVGKVIETAGTVHVLVNNAGGVCGQVGQPVEDVAAADWQAIFDANLTGAFNCSQAVTPAMKAAGGGRIVNTSSGAGLGVSLTGIQAYASAKAGLIGLTRQLAHELGPWQITVNSVAPGFVRSNPTTERQWQSYGEEGQRRLVESIALRRLGRPEDTAHAVLFLASRFASWITGQTLSVDGGR